MFRTIWVSGASAGIGAAFIAAAPAQEDTRIVGIARRPSSAPESLQADLSDPASWKTVEESFVAGLADLCEGDRALFYHCAGTVDPIGPMSKVDRDEYERAVLLNSASGQVLGRAFLVAAAAARIKSTLVTTSSPGARKPWAGVTHYSGGKAAIEHWTRSAAAEFGDGRDAPQIFSVVPHATDTAMMRSVMEPSVEEMPASEYFREVAAKGTIATPERVAEEIWTAIRDGVGAGEAVDVGATELAPPSSSQQSSR